MYKNKIHIWILYILICLLGLCFFLRVEPTIVWGADTFIGVCVAAMAITMAIIIGYQAVSAHEVKSELKEQQRENTNLRNQFADFRNTINSQLVSFQNSVRQEIEPVKSKTDSLETHADKILASTRESVSILNALILESSHNNSDIIAFDAFEKMHEALLFGLDYESKNIEFIFTKLRQYGSKITTLTFGGSFSYSNGVAYCCDTANCGKSLRSVLDSSILISLKETEKQIKEHKMFSSISHDYLMLMKKLYERLDIITKRNFPKDLKEREMLF